MSKKQQIRTINPSSVAKVIGCMYVLFGVLAGVFMAIIMVVPALAEPENTLSASAALVFAPVLLGILYGVMGFIFGYIVAWMYNVTAKKIGGIEIELN